MRNKTKMSHLEVNARIDFLNAYEHIVKSIQTRYVAFPDYTMVDMCIHHAEFNRALNQKWFDGNWFYLEKHLKISWPNMFARMKNTKFVQIEDFSYENFLLSFFPAAQYEIRSQKINLPKHAHLIKILVPEELVPEERQDTIYNSDWI